MHDIIDVISNIQDLYENNSSLGILKDFERVLAEMDIYVYKNWIDGELAYGPKVDRHWITAGFMWPVDNPDGGKRLVDIGCKLEYQKSYLLQPRPIKTPDDIRPNTKKGKLDRLPIWIVEIRMPKKTAFDMYKGYMDKMKNEDQPSASLKPTTPLIGAPAPVPPGGGMGMPPGGMPQPAPAV